MNQKKIAGILAVVVMSVMVSGYLAAPVWAANPILVKDVENPAQNPFWGHASGTILVNFANVAINVGTIPSGKRLVIEHIAGRCFTDVDDSIPEVNIWVTQKTATGFSSFSFPVVAQKQGTTYDGRASWVVSQPVRIYSDGGTGSYTSMMIYHSKITATASCYVSVSGYLVDTP